MTASGRATTISTASSAGVFGVVGDILGLVILGLVLSPSAAAV